MKKLVYIILISLMWVTVRPIFAQESRINKNKIGLIAGLGLATYNGDLTPRIQDWTPATNVVLGISYRVNRSISFRSEINLFQLKGENYEKGRNANFTTSNAELSLTATYDLNKLRRAHIYRDNYTPYLFGGVGVMSYSGKSGNKNDDKLNKHSGGYLPIIPVGVGLKVKASNYIDVAIEVGYRKTFSDNIDNIWDGNEKGSANNVNSGLSNAKFVNTDSYVFTQVKLIYSPDRIVKKKIKSVNGLSKHELKRIKHISNKIASSKKLLKSKSMVVN